MVVLYRSAILVTVELCLQVFPGLIPGQGLAPALMSSLRFRHFSSGMLTFAFSLLTRGINMPFLSHSLPWLIVSIHGLGCDVTPLRVWGARGCGEGVVDGVDGADAVVAGADQVGAQMRQ
jgi:hypothetical protein